MTLRLHAPAALSIAIAIAAGACANRAPSSERSGDAYPDGPYAIALGEVAPDLAFEGVDESGAPRTVHLHDYAETDERRPHLLVVQVSGGLWCGTCRWYGERAREVASFEGGDRVRRLDVVVGDRDNAPAVGRDAAAWQDAFALRGTAAVVADPAFQLGAVLDGEIQPLPLFVFIDTGTMRIVDSIANPDPIEYEHRIESAVAEMDGRTAPEYQPEELVDGIFHRNEWDLLSETTLPGAPPSDPTNAVADDPAAASLGRALFFDAGLSPSGAVSCATCHDPTKHLSDGRARAEGVGAGRRRTPSIGLSAHARWQDWDGRADTLWAQALGPVESSVEFDSSRVHVARRIVTVYAAEFAAAFPGESLPDVSQWPTSGKPGDPAFESMTAAARDEATRIFVDAGKAIAAYERTFRVKPNALDAYLAGQSDALSPEEKYGLQLFVREGCMQCHWGPRLTDDAFHDTRIPTGGRSLAADRGRIDGWTAWSSSEFRARSRWSDDPEAGRSSDARPTDSMLGQFKTPPLRGVADLERWGHDGAFDALAGVTESYGHGGVPEGDVRSAGDRDRWLPPFGETAQWGLVPFLHRLTADPIVP